MKPSHLCQSPSLAKRRLRALAAAILLLTCPALVQAVDTHLTYDGNGNQSVRQTATAATPVLLGSSSASLLAATGGTAGFSVNVSSPLAVTYQWSFNGVAITGATGDSLLLANVSSASEGNYTVTVTNSSGSVTSGAHWLRIDDNGNGLSDSWELASQNQTPRPDADDDGIYDDDEILNGTNPAVKDAFVWMAASGNFNAAVNWGRYRAPKAGDTVLINTGTFTLPSNTAVAASQVTVNVPFSTPPGEDYVLNISGNWTFNGPFTLSIGKWFQVIGGGSATLTGTTSLTGAKIFVTSAAKLTFANLTGHGLPAELAEQWYAYGTGSELTFSNLALISGGSMPGNMLDIAAQYGGKVSLPALAAITNPENNDAYASGVRLYAYNPGSLISAPVLSSFQNNDSQPGCLLSAYDGGTLSAPLLAAPKGVNINLNAQSNPQQFTSLVNATSFAINSGTVTMGNLASLGGLTSISAGNGAKVTFSAVTSHTMPAGLSATWKAEGTGSELTFSALTSVTGNAMPYCYLDINALSGGKVSLPALTAIAKPDDGDTSANSGVRLYAAYDSALLTAPALSSFQDNDSYPNSLLSASSTGAISTPLLTAPKGVSINLNALSTVQQFISLTNAASFTINSGTVVLGNLTSMTGCKSIYVSYGGKATFSSLASYTLPTGVNVNWTADGTGSELTFSALTSIPGGAVPGYNLTVLAQSGAKVSLPAMVNYTLPAGLDADWIASGAGSELAFANLSSITGNATPGTYLDITAQYGGKVSLPALTTITKPNDGDAYANSGVRLYANSNNALISAPMLFSFQDNDSHPGSLLSASSTGTMLFTTLNQSRISGVTLAGITLPAAPPPGSAKLLFSHVNGTALIWNLDASDNITSAAQVFGPYANWSATSYQRFADGTGRLLWSNAATGMATLWAMDANEAWTGVSKSYGPYVNWIATSFQRNPDGTGRLLWSNLATGAAALWTLDASDNWTSASKSYGPYVNWTATSYHRLADGTARLLWTDTATAAVALWTLDASDNWTNASKSYGPYVNWTANSYHRNADGTARLVWFNTATGMTAIWDLDASDTWLGTGKSLGPYVNWMGSSYFR